MIRLSQPHKKAQQQTIDKLEVLNYTCSGQGMNDEDRKITQVES